jgi:hypothetical protein
MKEWTNVSPCEWVVIDAAGRDRLVNPENTLIPAAGEKWKFAHRRPPPKDQHEEPSAADGGVGAAGGGGGGGGAPSGQGTAVEPTAAGDYTRPLFGSS